MVSPALCGEQAVRLDSGPLLLIYHFPLIQLAPLHSLFQICPWSQLDCYLLRQITICFFPQSSLPVRKQSGSHFPLKSLSSEATTKLSPKHCPLWTILKLYINGITQCMLFCVHLLFVTDCLLDLFMLLYVGFAL